MKPPDFKARTYDGRFSIAEWWAWSERVEIGRAACYRPFIEEGSLVFDIGSNRGRKTMIFRWLGASVIAVDPLYAWENEIMPEFFWRWGTDRLVTPVAKAVSDRGGDKVPIFVHKNLPYHSSLDGSWMTQSAHRIYYNDNTGETRDIETVTLSGLINIYGMPDFVKIDVEGHEDAVLRGLLDPVPALNMEYHQDWIPEKAIDHLNSLGDYEYSYTLNNSPVFVKPWGSSDDMLAHMRANLTMKGPGSWGDLYARQKGDKWKR